MDIGYNMAEQGIILLYCDNGGPKFKNAFCCEFIKYHKKSFLGAL